MYSLFRTISGLFGAEFVHHGSLSLLEHAPNICFRAPKKDPLKVMGLDFDHPVGLAAGFDKNGEHVHALAKLGFSFIEVGTVTPYAQAGNPKPRLFRVPEQKALINRMGFNNEGVDALVARLKALDYQGVLGVSIGPNKTTATDKVWQDYTYCMDRVYPLADYIAVNISSPNTPGLRTLQKLDYFAKLTKFLHAKQKELSDVYQKHVPMVIKISPDESDEGLKEMAGQAVKAGLDGMIITNTTVARKSLRNTRFERELGGLSGKPLASRAGACLELVKSEVGDDLTLIASGGVYSADEAKHRLKAGASLVQLYTGLVYRGPRLIREILD